MTIWGTFASAILLTLAPAKGGEIADSIHGISIGTPRERVEALLKTQESERRQEREDEDEEEGKKLARVFEEGELKSVAVAFDKERKVRWVSGFFRPGSEKPFAEFGPLEKATVSENTAIWTVRNGKGAYRLVAKGGSKKASVIYLLKLQ